MRVYFCSYQGKLYRGDYRTCLQWALKRTSCNNLLIDFYVIRAGEKQAKLVAQVSSKGIRFIQDVYHSKIRHGAVWVNL
jgi:hypothetical protein